MKIAAFTICAALASVRDSALAQVIDTRRRLYFALSAVFWEGVSHATIKREKKLLQGKS